MVMPGMFAMLCFLAGFLFEVLFFCAAGLLLLIPGMFCISCPCGLALLVDESINPVMMTALSPTTRMKAPKPNLFIVPPVEVLN